ncbi:MAG: bacteriohemerythrin [Gammaproteobacteria bacterium]|nr:bacteriohemerythrin [Gammaproteobacteria bacterium]
MALFNWDASYCIGIDKVDRQHEHLVAIVNRLDEAVAAGRDDGEIKGILKEALQYTQYHFKTEETLMANAGVVDTEHFRLHKRQHEEFVQTVVTLVGGLLQNGQPVTGELLQFLIKWLAEHILGSDREMARVIAAGAAVEDDDARLLDAERAESKLLAALQESEWRFRVIADAAPVLMWMSQADGRRPFFNQRWTDFTGLARSELEHGWQSAVHPDHLAALEARYAGADSGVGSVEYRLRRHDGDYRWMRETAVARHGADGAFEGYVGSCVDITDLKEHEAALTREVEARTAELRDANEKLAYDKAALQALFERLQQTQAQLLQSEKMASIGQLAAGVAHEINNPVGYVKSNLNALGGYLNDLVQIIETFGTDPAAAAQLIRDRDFAFMREDAGKLLGESLEGVDRVQHIVQDLKNFSHVDQAEWQAADLGRSLDSTLTLVWNDLKYKAEIVKDYQPLPPVECLSRQINQVFMNILVNAGQAIAQRGTITLRTRAEGAFAVVEIADTGQGMPPEVAKRIFEPFFTTKPVGSGTGLGLSIAYGIVKKHHGSLEVESTPGKGTTFRLRLPFARAEAAA